MIKKRTIIHEGSAKTLYEGPDESTIIQHFKDDISAFNKIKDHVEGKGIINNRISEVIMIKLEEMGIPTHFIRSLNMREQLVKKVDIIPVEVVIRNVVAGKLSTDLDLTEGMVLPKPIIEFYYKNNHLNNPMVNEDHILTFGWASNIELEDIRAFSLRANDFLSGLFQGAGIRLIDFKLEFGRIFIHDFESVIIADEISPDTCRLWDINTNQKLDKDVFRYKLGDVKTAYLQVAEKLGIIMNNDQYNANGTEL